MERNKTPDSGGPLTNGFVWLAVLAAGTFLIHEVPWQGSRPVSQEPKLYRYVDNNRVDARLWQDPIGTAAAGREDLKKRIAGIQKQSAPQEADILFKALCARKANDFLALGVMVQGGSYPESAESRRRARYAVFAGLNSFGYVPEDQEHLRYFEPDNFGPVTIDELQPVEGKQASPPTFPEFIAYEWLVESEQNSGKRAANGLPEKILLLWLDENYFGAKTLARTDLLMRFVSGREGCDPARAAAAERAASDRKLLILGPGDSGELKAMATEAVDRKTKLEASLGNAAGEGAEPMPTFYAYGATAVDRAILDGVPRSDEKISVGKFFKDKGVTLFRTIGTDDALASQLRDELALREIRPAEVWCAGKPGEFLPLGDTLTTRPDAQHVVLIAEWDTVYGRSLPRTVAQALSTTKGTSEACPTSMQQDALPWIRTFTYLRGLDGQRPTAKAAADTDTNSNNANNGTDKPDKTGTSSSDDKRIERPEGSSQLDYLRRLAIDLRAYNRKLQTNGASIRAVGVLGSDVYDKLMIIQALNEEFPDAIFFTTDLDARLMHPNELQWTRNLIVASNFGLKLSPVLQREIAPFRDSYETSIYLSTMIAINNAQDRCVDANSVPKAGCVPMDREEIQKTIDQWLMHPRVFEVGRNGAFDFSQGSSQGVELLASADPISVGQIGCGPRNLANCTDIHPSPTSMFPQPRDRTLRLAAALLLIGTIALAIVTGLGHRFADRMYTSISKFDFAGRAAATATIALLVAALAYVAYRSPNLWASLFGFLTQYGSGVPFTFLQGLSLWPTELLRLIALVMSWIFIYMGWKSLDRNVDVISGKFLWHTAQEALGDEVEAQYKKWSTAEKIWNAMSFRFPARFSTSVGDRAGLEPEAVGFWLEYIYRGRFRARIVRVAILTVLYYLTGALLMSILGWPVSPVRGAVSFYFDQTVILVAVFSLLLLIFFVVDAIAFASQMVHALQRDLQTRASVDGAGIDGVSRWPKSTLEHFKTALNVDPRYLDQWIAMRFIAERTSVVAPLIYYPFIVISLMIVSRSAVFANWNTPIGLILVITGSVLIVAGCAIWLRMTAESARRKAIEDLTLETIRLSSEGAPGKQTAGQLEIMIAEIRALRIGAFAPYSQQPFLTALLFPLGSFGGTALIEYLTKANL